MGFFTYKIENREHSLEEVLGYVNEQIKFEKTPLYYLINALELSIPFALLTYSWVNLCKQYGTSINVSWFGVASFITTGFGIAGIMGFEETSKHQLKINLLRKNVLKDLKFSGIELVNFLNSCNKTKFHTWGESIQDLKDHKFNMDKCLTLDNLKWYSWPCAVLNVYNEEIADNQHCAVESTENLGLIPEVMMGSAIV